MEWLGRAVCTRLYSWPLREALRLVCVARCDPEHWLMYSFSCGARSAPSLACTHARTHARELGTLGPTRPATQRCWCARTDNATVALARTRTLVRWPPKDGQPGTMLAFALAVLQRLVRRPPQDGRPGTAAAQVRPSENPRCFEQQRVREERRCVSQHCPASMHRLFERPHPALPNVRHERRQKGEAFLTSARWECEGTSHLLATASKRQDWWLSRSSI